MAFPDVEEVLMSLLDDLGYTCTALPDDDDFDTNLPMIVINRSGGGDDGITDWPIVSIIVVDKSRPAAWKVTSKVSDRIRESGCTEVDGILIDTAEVMQGNVSVPDIVPDNRFVDTLYKLSFRALRE